MDIKVTFLAAWFAASFITLISATTSYIYLRGESFILQVSENFNLYAALPDKNAVLTDAITSSDGRSKIIESFFKKYNSPLYIYADYFTGVADKYALEWRLLPAISMQESNGGKRIIKSSYNPFGFGIYGDKVVRFNSWEEAIERVGRALKEDYLDKGYETVEEIMVKYTPPSILIGGAWAKGVNSFIFELN